MEHFLSIPDEGLTTSLSPDGAFALLVIFCIVVELGHKSKGHKRRVAGKLIEEHGIRRCLQLALRRLSGELVGDFVSEIGHFNWSEEQKDLLGRWASGEIHFVEQ